MIPRKLRYLALLILIVVWSWSTTAAGQISSGPPPSTQPHSVDVSSGDPDQSLPAKSLQVIYKNGLLTITANNASLGEVLREIAHRTGAEIEVPGQAGEAVFVQLGPGPARNVVAALLGGSQFNYILLGSSSDPNAVTKAVLFIRPPAEKFQPVTPRAPQYSAASEVPQSESTAAAVIDPQEPVRAQQNLVQQYRRTVLENFQRGQQPK